MENERRRQVIEIAVGDGYLFVLELGWGELQQKCSYCRAIALAKYQVRYDPKQTGDRTCPTHSQWMVNLAKWQGTMERRKK